MLGWYGIVEPPPSAVNVGCIIGPDQNELDPEQKALDAFYRQFRCKRCQGPCRKEFIGSHVFNDPDTFITYCALKTTTELGNIRASAVLYRPMEEEHDNAAWNAVFTRWVTGEMSAACDGGSDGCTFALRNTFCLHKLAFSPPETILPSLLRLVPAGQALHCSPSLRLRDLLIERMLADMTHSMEQVLILSTRDPVLNETLAAIQRAFAHILGPIDSVSMMTDAPE